MSAKPKSKGTKPKLSDDLAKRISEDIQKSGFGSEMSAMKIFLDAGWGCNPGKSYFDHDEKKIREIDLEAYCGKQDWSLENKGRNILFEYHVLAEVKKSERPWIVFSHEAGLGSCDGWDNPYVNWNLPCKLSDISPILANTSTRHELSWMGYNIHEAFKEPTQSSRWYSAAVSVCKACADDFNHEAYSEDMLKGWGKDTFLAMANPIVILDGIMVRASLSKTAKVQLEQIDFAPFIFEFRTPALKRGSCRLDIVTLAGLPHFIKQTNKRIEKIYAFIHDRKLS